MAKLFAVLGLLALSVACASGEHAHQSVARLKRDTNLADLYAAHSGSPAHLYAEQQHIDQVPDEEQPVPPADSDSGSAIDEVPVPTPLLPATAIESQIIKESPNSNVTKATMRDLEVPNCGQGPNTMKNLNRIVNGTRSGPGMFPWQVYLRISTNQGEMLCGGSVLNENWIITAAHCISEQDGHYTATAIEVVAGALDRFNQESSKQKVYADCAFKHPNWRGIQSNFANDIALVRMPRMSGLKINGNTVNGICLPPKTNPRFTYAGPAIVSGWGLTTNRGSTSRTLQFTKVSLLTHQQCQQYQYPVPIINSMVCQGLDYSSPCQGDSGGPLQIFRGGKWVQYGLVSFGPGICNNRKIPNAVYTQVSAHMTWLENTIGSYNVNPTCSPRRIAIS